MKDWRAGGELVRERGRQFLSAYANDRQSLNPINARLFRESVVVMLSMPVAWLAIGFVDAYDRTRFNYRHFLQSHPDLLMGADRPPKNGRPLGNASRVAAALACCFYDTWLDENEKRGINDYGHRREMKDFAARAVVEDIFVLQFSEPKLHTLQVWQTQTQFGAKDPESFIEVVRDLMEKPRKRRDPGDSASFNFLATSTGLLLSLPPKPPRKL